MAYDRFNIAIKRMEPLLDKLKSSDASKVHEDGWRDILRQGVYVFYEDGRPLYVGRSNNLRTHIRGHGAEGSDRYSATFAFLLLKEKIGEHQGLTGLKSKTFATMNANAKGARKGYAGTNGGFYRSFALPSGLPRESAKLL